MRHDADRAPGRERVAHARPVHEIKVPRPGQPLVAERDLELPALDLRVRERPHVDVHVAPLTVGLPPVGGLVLDVLGDRTLDAEPAPAPFEGCPIAGVVGIVGLHGAFQEGLPVELEPVAVADARAVVPDEAVFLRGGSGREGRAERRQEAGVDVKP